CAPAAMAFSLYRRPAPERRDIMFMRSPWTNLRRLLSWATRPRTSVRHRPTRQRLCLESLEDRTVPTVVFNSVFGGDTIFWVPGNSAGQPAGPGHPQTTPITYN